MTLSHPISSGLMLQLALILGGLTVIGYILKMRRRRFEVPFSTLWHRVLREKETRTLWKHLRRFLSLLLALLLLVLLLFAALDPQWGGQDEDARNVVIIVDASASMKAIDEGEDGEFARIDEARRKAHELLDAMGGGDTAMIMRMDGQTTPLSRFVSDKPLLHRVVTSIEATDTPADLERALSAAADALRERQNPMIVLIGDGAYRQSVLDRVRLDKDTGIAVDGSVSGTPAGPMGTDTEPKSVVPSEAPKQPTGAATPKSDAAAATALSTIDLTGIDLRYLPVGESRENVGILAFSARRYLADKTTYSVFIEVQNFGDEPATRKLVVYNGDSPIDVKNVTLKPGERLREIYPKLSGGTGSRMRAELQEVEGRARTDQFALDDTAYALLRTRKRQRVLLVITDNLYLEGMMLSFEHIKVDKVLPEEYEQMLVAGELPEYDAVIFDDFAPEGLPPPKTDLMYFHPTGEHAPFEIRDTIVDPHVTEVTDYHPVMRWVSMSDAHFDETSIYTIKRAEGDMSLARYVRDTMIATKRDGPRKIVAFGFSLLGTDLVLRVAFPLLVINTLDWFAGDDSGLLTTYRTGRRFRVSMDAADNLTEVEVVTPLERRTRAPLNDGFATFYGNTVGVYTLIAGKGTKEESRLELAANLSDPNESNIAPDPELTIAGRQLEPPGSFAVSPSRSIWTYLVLLMVLISCIEWITYNRRITV